MAFAADHFNLAKRKRPNHKVHYYRFAKFHCFVIGTANYQEV